MTMPPLKHIIDNNNGLVNISSTPNVTTIAVGTINPNSYSTPSQVRNGSLVKKLTVQLDIIDTNPSSIEYIDWYLWFNIGGTQSRPFPDLTVDTSNLRNQIFHQDGTACYFGQATAASYVVPWKNSWRLEVNVPRAWQQLNENDKIELVVGGGANVAGILIKVKVIYKEIFP